jgi:hypothetical protein
VIGHKLVIESDGDDQGTKVTLDGRVLDIEEIAFVHTFGQAPYLRFISVVADAPTPDLKHEIGSARRTEKGRLEVIFGTRPI